MTKSVEEIALDIFRTWFQLDADDEVRRELTRTGEYPLFNAIAAALSAERKKGEEGLQALEREIIALRGELDTADAALLAAADRIATAEAELKRLRGTIEPFGHALESAAILLDIMGDKQPFSDGYDDVHDAHNEIWHQLQKAEEMVRSLAQPNEESGNG